MVVQHSACMYTVTTAMQISVQLLQCTVPTAHVLHVAVPAVSTLSRSVYTANTDKHREYINYYYYYNN